MRKSLKKLLAFFLGTIHGSAGFVLPEKSYLGKVKKCYQQTSALMILNEIQPGFGCTGKLFAFEHYENALPDILVMGKGMWGSMPVGAFMSLQKIMSCLSYNPMLGHITTFGDHRVTAASALATLYELIESRWMQEISRKEKIFRELLVHKEIQSIQGHGLMLAYELKNKEYVLRVTRACFAKGLIVFWLLFSGDLRKRCRILLQCLDENSSTFWMMKASFENIKIEGVLPVIIQDKDTKVVLETAFMNQSALDKSLAGKSCYFLRDTFLEKHPELQVQNVSLNEKKNVLLVKVSSTHVKKKANGVS